MAAPADFIRAQIAATNIATYGAQLAVNVVQIQRASEKPHGDPEAFAADAREDIDSLRAAIASVETALALWLAKQEA